MNFKAIILNLILGLSLVNIQPVKAELSRTAMYGIAAFASTFLYNRAEYADSQGVCEKMQWVAPTAFGFSVGILISALFSKEGKDFKVALLATIAGYVTANS